MFNIEPKTNNIKLTKGDTATMFVQVFDLEGKEYIVGSEDEVKMTVRNPYDGQEIFTKYCTPEHFIIFDHEDTAHLKAMSYVYDVQLTTEEGYVYTIVSKAVFHLDCEVTI